MDELTVHTGGIAHFITLLIRGSSLSQYYTITLHTMTLDLNSNWQGGDEAVLDVCCDGLQFRTDQ